jgi:hypothetical protein
MRINSISYKKALFFLILVIIISINSAVSQPYSENRKVSKSFKISANSTVEINNKYGKIQIVQGNIDSVRFEVNISVKSSESKKVHALAENIDIDFTETSFYISVKTIIGSAKKGILSDLKSLAESFVPTESNVRIDYTITLPNYINLKLTNKYGDVFLDNIKGTFQLNLSNGDFKANTLEGNSEIDLKFCHNADINTMNSGRFNMLYAELRVGKTKQLNITSKTSKIKIDEIDVLKIQSKSDKYVINSVNYIYGDAYFSDFTASRLSEEMSYSSKYGNINLENISKSFSFISINSKMTDLNLFFEKGTSYQLDLTHKDNKINYPREIAKLQEKTIDEKNEILLTYGTIGKSEAKAKVKIEGEQSAINLFQK